jgi:hypothetical protein
MTGWTSNDLESISGADELQLASLREDGTLRKPVTIWVVRVSDDLYVRSYRGRESIWFRHARLRGKGHISAGGVTKDVVFVDVSYDEVLNKEIDAAYQSKYRRHGAMYVNHMVAPKARETTLKLVLFEQRA